MIEGDNLEVLKLLQKSYAGKVKLIYIDPPYNTGKDFVYPDNFQDNIKNYLELTGQVGEGGQKLSSNTETSGRFHTDWLKMMYPRLRLARNLLREDGFLAVSISDVEVAHLRSLLDEIFGGTNLVETFFWESIFRPSNMSKRTRKNAEYVILYAKDASRDFELVERTEDAQGDASLTQNNNAPRQLIFPKESIRITLPDGNYSRGVIGEIEVHDDIIVSNGRNAKDVRITGKFKWSQKYLDDEIAKGVTLTIKTKSLIPYYRKTYQQTTLRPTKIIPNDIVGDVLSANAEINGLFGQDVFSYPKPTTLPGFLLNCVGIATGDIVLDFFAGSGTTGHAVQARASMHKCAPRFIVVQLPEALSHEVDEQSIATALCAKLGKPHNIAELTKERLRRAAKKIKEENPMFAGDLGFRVFKLDSTNIQEWDPNREKIAESLEASVEHLKTDRTEKDILFELLLKLGLDLCVPIEEKKIAGHTVQSVGAGTLIVCLSEKIAKKDVETLVKGIIQWHKDLKPAGETTIVFRDSAFSDDVAKTNLTAILAQSGLETVRSL